jgi:acid stress-induced BolA-like protein IbaG/YrbA
MATNNAVNQIGILPSFMAVNNADQTNVTGDGTDYTVTFVNEIYDLTSNFDGASTFTAPLTG